jgi:iron complex outermembrane receptor protein
MMTKNPILRQAIRHTLAHAAAASVALPVTGLAAESAANAAGPPDPPQSQTAPALPALQEVVVTGSRIYIPGLKSTSPVTSISAKQIANTGATTIEDVLNTLPQVTADMGAMASNGATGTASVNLRDLGPQRTLVLVDGKRLMPGGSGTNVADIDNIPTALIEGVDVLTGGASSVYGAHAVASVATRCIVLHQPDSVAYFNERMQIARSVGAVPALSTCPIST